jgi:hypothetical protein
MPAAIFPSKMSSNKILGSELINFKNLFDILQFLRHEVGIMSSAAPHIN